MMLGRLTAGAARRSLRATTQKRSMGGGGHYMHVDERHRSWGEAFGIVCWVWVFHRARNDLPVLLGYRHAWEHAEDPFAPHGHGHGHGAEHAAHPEEQSHRQQQWDNFTEKATKQKDDDDDDEEEED